MVRVKVRVKVRVWAGVRVRVGVGVSALAAPRLPDGRAYGLSSRARTPPCRCEGPPRRREGAPRRRAGSPHSRRGAGTSTRSHPGPRARASRAWMRSLRGAGWPPRPARACTRVRVGSGYQRQSEVQALEVAASRGHVQSGLAGARLHGPVHVGAGGDTGGQLFEHGGLHTRAFDCGSDSSSRWWPARVCVEDGVRRNAPFRHAARGDPFTTPTAL
eukprot:scaffold2006_cov53-Phaeocystis_antarctica.AAC.1